MSSDDVKDLSTTSVFFKDTFEIDDYLSKCTLKSDLLTLRSDLKYYGQDVYSDMIEILKSETDNIVNLAEDLTNLNAKIDDLAVPVAQLKEEIRALYFAIINSESSFKQHLDIAHTYSTKRDLLNMRTGILSSLTYIKKIIACWNNNQDINILERAVKEYSFQYLYSCELGINEIIKEDLVVSIANELLELVHELFLKAIGSNNSDIILRCLSMYANLAKQGEAEKFVRENIVRPTLSNIFSQNYLEEHNNNMQALYNDAIKFLNTNLLNVRLVLERNPDIKGFSFVINSFWREVDNQLRDNLPNITAPGNPEFFQTRYLHTQEFLEQIISATNTPDLLETDPSFEAHMKRFNLPVYFEIRFQQIAANFETELLMDPMAFDESMVLQDGIFMLSISATLWTCIQKCLHKEVYIAQLSDQLIKLVMLLISRYITWYETVLEWPSNLEDPVCSHMEKFVMCTLMDIIVLKYLLVIPNDAYDNIFKIVPPQLQPAFVEISKMNKEFFSKLTMKLQEGVVKFKIQQCAVILQQVSSIPRIYRRTNRGAPNEHSSYITEASLILTDLYNTYKDRIEEKTLEILDMIVAGVSDRYIELVKEVLKSVCKTEESLKRLKNRNPNVSDDPGVPTKNEGMSDETKIREQIKLDVSYFVQEVQQFSKNISKSSLEKLLKESGVHLN